MESSPTNQNPPGSEKGAEPKAPVVFSLATIGDHFDKAAKMYDTDVDIKEYDMAFGNLNEIFPLLGRLFHFIYSDIAEKVDILEQHRASPAGEHYASVGQMLDYEKANGLLEPNADAGKQLANGSRTLLRLHRALHFLAELIHGVVEAKDEAKTSTIAVRAYDDSMAHFHPWLIRKAVHLAVHTLPYRGQLIETLKGDTPADQIVPVMRKTVEACRLVYARVQAMYEARDLTELP